MSLRLSLLILPLVFAAACSRGVRPEPPDARSDQPTGGTGGRSSSEDGAGMCINRFFPKDTDALDGKGNPRFGESDVLILFDGSESTGIACGNGTRASVMADTIKTLVDEYQDRIAFGLMLFPYAAWCGADEAPGCCVGSPSVSWARQMSVTIRAALDSRPAPQGSSPMAQALQMAGSKFRERYYRMVAAENSVVLLVTDGQPGCHFGTGDAAASSACQEAVRAIHDLGHMEPPVRTLVLGPGPGDPAGKTDCLRALSEAAAEVNKAHDASMMRTGFTVDDVDALRDALESTFNTYAVANPSCEIVLEPAPLANARIAVFVDGQQIPEDEAYGWQLLKDRKVADGPITNTVSLRGEYCTRLKHFRYNRVEVKYDCRIIIVRHGEPSLGRIDYCKT